MTKPTLREIKWHLFWSKVEQSDEPDECWPWTGHLSNEGYVQGATYRDVV